MSDPQSIALDLSEPGMVNLLTMLNMAQVITTEPDQNKVIHSLLPSMKGISDEVIEATKEVECITNTRLTVSAQDSGVAYYELLVLFETQGGEKYQIVFTSSVHEAKINGEVFKV